MGIFFCIGEGISYYNFTKLFKQIDMRARTTEPKQTFSVYLPTSLYQRLIDRAGRGQINTFIKEAVEKELTREETNLSNAYRECYANNPHLLELAKQWEKAEIESWLNYEKEKDAKKRGN